MFYSVVMLALLISLVMLGLFVLISLWVENSLNTNSSYECGFDGKSLTRMTFSYRFFLIAILFLIFDVEISLLLPLPFLVTSSFSYFILSVFVLLLLVGLLIEIKIGSLDWL